MFDPQNSPSIPSATIPLTDILSIISLPARWHLLRELASGDQFMVSELAERAGQSPHTTSKNMAELRKAGIVTQRRNRLYQIVPQFVVDKAERVLDLDIVCCGSTFASLQIALSQFYRAAGDYPPSASMFFRFCLDTL